MENIIARSADQDCTFKFRLIDEIPVVGGLYTTKEGVIEKIISMTEMHKLLVLNGTRQYRFFIIMTSKNWKYDNKNYSVWYVAVKE